ncbi:MAG: Hpt domain-containing protein [Cyclobacteriaceae bacterium]
MVELIELTIPILTEASTELEVHRVTNNIKALKKVAHNICGTARSLMLNKLDQLSTRLEKLDDQEIIALEKLVADTIAEINYLKKEVLLSSRIKVYK